VSEYVTPHEIRGFNVVSPTAKGWVQAGEEVVQVGSENARKLGLDRAPSFRDQSHCEHGPGEPQHGDLKDEELDIFTPVVLGIGVGECQDQCYCGLVQALQGWRHKSSPRVKMKLPR